jgi:hypothetical protein
VEVPVSGPIVHIGYHKTGTSWLQKRLFRADLGFDLVSLSKKRSDFAWVHDFDFEPERYRREFVPGIEASWRQGRVPVISQERLSGNPHSGGFDSRTLADRLHAVFPHARVLIVVREQRAMILSAYSQYVKAGGAVSLRDYLFGKRDHRRPEFSFDHFRYDRLVEHYQSRFGRERVLVQTYERFRESPREYVSSILDFCGAKLEEELTFSRVENPSLGPVALGLQRWLNPFVVRNSLNGSSPLALPRLRPPVRALMRGLDWLTPDSWNERLRQRWRRRIAEACSGRYEASNRNLAAQTGLDLAGYGYSM